MFIWMAAIMIAIPSAKLYDTYSFPEEPEKEFCHPGTSRLNQVRIIKPVL